MKVAQLRDVLGRFAALHERAGDPNKAHSLRMFADALRADDRRPVAKLVEKLRAARQLPHS